MSTPVKSSLQSHLTVCIVNYNGEKRLPSCLDALLDHGAADQELIVVDNASTDRSTTVIHDRYPGVRLLALQQNLGPAAARNAGFEEARNDRVLFIDNDVVVAPDAIGRLTEALNVDPSAAVAMPRVCYANQPEMIQYDGAGWHPMGLMMLHHANRPVAESNDAVRVIGSVVTACLLVDKPRLAMSSPFDPSFFFNYEDHDFGIRSSIAGHRLISVPKARCFHGSGTEGLSYRPHGEYAKLRAYFLIRNRWQILLKNYQLRTLLLLSPAFVLYEGFQIAGVTSKGWLLEWLRSLGWICTHIPEILRKRRAVQQSRKTKDVALFEDGPLPFTDDLANRGIQRTAIGALNYLLRFYYRLIRPML